MEKSDGCALLKKEQKGFTLVEVVITVFIILVLAGVGIASYFKARQKGYDASAKTAVASFKKAQGVYRSQYDGYTDTLEALELVDKNLLDSPGVTFEWIAADSSGYTMNIRHTNGSRWFTAQEHD